jgi:hypothetical protein
VGHRNVGVRDVVGDPDLMYLVEGVFDDDF